MKEKAVVSPVIAEFGWVVFDIQPKVRKFFEDHEDCHKVVVGNPAFGELFELADEIIPIELPESFTPCGRGAEDHYGLHNSNFYNQLIQRTQEHYNPEHILKIPYENRFDQWDVEESHRKFYKDKMVDSDEYITISCRNLNRGAEKNWDPKKYQSLVDWIIEEYNLPIYLVGLEKDNFVPDGVIVPETKNVGDHISLLSHSKFHFGSNTGTSHLSTMCGCPLFTWGEGMDLRERMVEWTNPHKTPAVCVIEGNWDPELDFIKKELYNFVEKNINLELS